MLNEQSSNITQRKNFNYPISPFKNNKEYEYSNASNEKQMANGY